MLIDVLRMGCLAGGHCLVMDANSRFDVFRHYLDCIDCS